MHLWRVTLAVVLLSGGKFPVLRATDQSCHYSLIKNIYAVLVDPDESLHPSQRVYIVDQDFRIMRIVPNVTAKKLNFEGPLDRLRIYADYLRTQKGSGGNVEHWNLVEDTGVIVRGHQKLSKTELDPSTMYTTGHMPVHNHSVPANTFLSKEDRRNILWVVAFYISDRIDIHYHILTGDKMVKRAKASFVKGNWQSTSVEELSFESLKIYLEKRDLLPYYIIATDKTKGFIIRPNGSYWHGTLEDSIKMQHVTFPTVKQLSTTQVTRIKGLIVKPEGNSGPDLKYCILDQNLQEIGLEVGDDELSLVEKCVVDEPHLIYFKDTVRTRTAVETAFYVYQPDKGPYFILERHTGRWSENFPFHTLQKVRGGPFKLSWDRKCMGELIINTFCSGFWGFYEINPYDKKDKYVAWKIQLDFPSFWLYRGSQSKYNFGCWRSSSLCVNRAEFKENELHFFRYVVVFQDVGFAFYWMNDGQKDLFVWSVVGLGNKNILDRQGTYPMLLLGKYCLRRNRTTVRPSLPLWRLSD